MLVVADGLGGQPAGNLASATLVRVLAENLPAATPLQLREAILADDAPLLTELLGKAPG